MRRVSISRAAWRECSTAAAIFLAAACAGMIYISSWGQTADILQTSYGPSVMLACGRGFANPRVSDVPALAAFLQPELHRDGPPLIDRFDCAALPEDLATVPFTGIHKRTWHLFYVAGWVWRVFGVAWSSLTPLYGLLYGLSAVAAYGLFRLLLHPAIAVFCTALFVMSPVQLHYLPRLRDFAKAPFMLFALFCLLLLLACPKGWKRALWTGAAAGAAVGMATGFRAEAVLYLVVFAPAVVLFYPGWRWPAWAPRAVAIAAFLLCFLAAGWPVLMKFQTYGERTHPFLMGFGNFYDGRLGVDNDLYQVAESDLDTEALAMMNAHNQYLDSAAPPIIYETPGYEAVGDDYFLRNLLWKLPGDLAARTAAAALRILDELRPNRNAFMPRGITNQFLEPVYRVRVWLMDTLFSRTRYAALALIVLLGAFQPRLGLLALYLMFCLAGMASVQFATRHYFHLEFIPLLPGGLLLQLAWMACELAGRKTRVRVRDALRERAWWIARLGNGAGFSLAAFALVMAPLFALRWHQDRQLHALFMDYESAERDTVWPAVVAATAVDGEHGVDGKRVLLACDPVTLPGGLPEAGPEGFYQVDMLVIELAPSEQPLRLQFRYAGDTSERDLSWHTTVAPAATDTGVEGARDGGEEAVNDLIRLYVPVYNAVWPDTPDNATWGELPPTWTRFEGLELAAEDLPRLKGMHHFRYAAGYTPLIAAVLREGWESQPLYQRFVR